ncbi:MAG TPA: 3-oxoacyl-ACP reductase [Solirubrobacterales bacterium]|nr:3-oxoacyl-ACP reductase [Solirubrobacterales bacterium]
MSDRYTQLVNTPPGKLIAQQVGLPRPNDLDRHSLGDPVIRGRVLSGGAGGGRLSDATGRVLTDAGAQTAGAVTEIPEGERFKALVYDATGIADSTELVELQAFFHPAVPRLAGSGRVVVLGTMPAACKSPREATAQRALEGFTRSLGKEVGRGTTVQLVYVEPGAEGEIDSTLRFLLSPRSAYVSGQVVRVGKPNGRAGGKAGGSTSASANGKAGGFDWERPLAGKVALVTGASRGIGKAIAETLHRDGADLRVLDIPAAGEALREVAKNLGGQAIELDITDPEAPARIVEWLGGELDIVVHNAGVTKDRTIAKMPADRWNQLMEINLSSEERINDALLEAGLPRAGGRIVCVSSMSGIAGNSGQTNYATSKAGVIGMVESMAPVVAEQGVTINAVAPGFIETEMTDRMPFAIREAGRRMNSLSQGGKPIDVAETIAWFASPASAGVNANTVRVCGQSLLGA